MDSSTRITVILTLVGLGTAALAIVVPGATLLWLAIAVSSLTAAAWYWLHMDRISRSDEAKPPQAEVVKRDLWLSDAIKWAVTGIWDLDDWPAGDEVLAVAKEVRQLASDGDLTIWGKRADGDVWEFVPADYWKYCQVEWLSFIRGRAEMRTEIAESGRTISPRFFHALMASRAQVIEQWPLATLSDSADLTQVRRDVVWLREKLTSYEPIAAYAAEAAKRRDRLSSSDDPAWLDRRRNQARREFVHACNLVADDLKHDERDMGNRRNLSDWADRLARLLESDH